MRKLPFLSFLTHPILRIVFLFFAIILVIQLFLGNFVYYGSSIKQTQQQLQASVKRIKEDLVYKDGKWNTYKYTADPDLPDTYPLYIVASDGYVIDRWKPVHGLLDVSDFKHLLSFDKPQTITTPTNQTWRIFSKPIYNQNSDILGVITVSNFYTGDIIESDVDNKLIDQVNILSSRITVHGNSINTQNIDPREISYDIAFQVVDRFNKILAKSNNTNSVDQIPNFIDRSYVGDALSSTTFREVQDSQTREKFLIYTSPITNKNGSILGVIVIGKSISFIDTVMKDFYTSELIFAIVGILFIILGENWIAKKYLASTRKMNIDDIQKISFNKATSTILIGSIEIAIPYATNQYYLCEALFSSPRKKWEIDELLEKFGDSISSNWRKVYDAMLIVNKKVQHVAQIKLIIAKEKIYQINPEILSKINS